MKTCSNCGVEGHNIRGCKSLGRQIIQQENQKIDRIPDDLGTIPKAGLWLINPGRKRIAGKISQVKKNGDIVWNDVYGTVIESTPETIKEGNYLFLELEPKHLLFEVVK